MPYIIDGHNLIAAMPDIELDAGRDERDLLERLRPFAQREGRSLYVYFDRGYVGGRKNFRIGRIHVHFSVPPRSADDAIHSHLQSIGSEGPNWVVVSSDREIRDQAERIGARTVSSLAFSRELQAPDENRSSTEKPIQPLTDEEIDAWEALFRRGTDEI
jgi:predicted RNA-binding protein with PIN domain